MTSSKNQAKDKSSKFPIVALGGSAGALTSFELFFVNTALESGIAYIVIQHLDPEKDSLLPELIRRNTTLPVHVIVDKTEVLKDNIYVVPPKSEAFMEGVQVVLKPYDENTNSSTIIDNLFTSLAKEIGSKAAVLVLSGMGKDGSEGVKAIKAHGGTTLCQRPNTAAFDNMPNAAIQTGMVDFVLAVEDIPLKLNRWANDELPEEALVLPMNEKQLFDLVQKIFSLIISVTGHDFSLYKMNTISRRIESRMNTLKILDLHTYVELLEKTPSEIPFLFKELLIGVTNFFRDEESFDILKTKIFPPLMREKKDGDTLRIWVSACSTGEEAYSLAIVIKEILEDIGALYQIKIQIFATDIDEDAIHIARIGKYPASIDKNVSQERLEKYFIKKDNKYQVIKEIREMLIFAPHSVIKDPPFTKLDVITCRNLLIYLTAELQKKIIYSFKYALNPNGILILGSSESLGAFGDLFNTLDMRWRIFRRLESASMLQRAEHKISSTVSKVPHNKEIKLEHEKKFEVSMVVQNELLNNFAPSSVVINKNLDLIYVNGSTGAYLEMNPGLASLNILDMAREGIRFELSNAIQSVSLYKNVVIKNNLIVKNGNSFKSVTVKVMPFAEMRDSGMILIVFEESKFEEEEFVDTNDHLDISEAVSDLKKELIYTKKNLQSTIEEMEASMEELTTLNEEAQSNNEELQSTNEELTTSQEEMESLNNELTGTNSELQSKIIDFTELSNDMKNLLQNSDAAVLFLDNYLNVRRYSPGAVKIIKLIPSDKGRPLSDIAMHINGHELIAQIQELLETLFSKEFELQSTAGEWYSIKVSPYRTADNFIDGAVVLFSNITKTKQLTDKLIQIQQYNEKIVDGMRDALVLMDPSFTILSVNNAFYNQFNETSGNTIGKSFLKMSDGQWDSPQISIVLNKIIQNKVEFNDIEVMQEFGYLGPKRLLLNGRIIMVKNCEPEMLLLMIKDAGSK